MGWAQGVFSIPKIRVAVSLLCAALVSACVPLSEHYYEPSAPEGKVVREACHGNVGAPTDMELTRGSVKVFVVSRYDSASSVTLTIQLGLAHDDHVQARWDEMHVTDGDGHEIPFNITDRSGYNIPAVRGAIPTISADEISDMTGSRFEFYELSATMTGASDGPLPDELTLVVPTFVVNGVTYPSVEIHFKKSSGVWVFPINC